VTARDEVLRRVRTALRDAPVRTDPHGVLPPAGVGVPREYLRDHTLDDVLATFVERVEDYRAAVTSVPPDELPGAVRAALGDARRVVVAPGFDASWLSDGAGADELAVLGDDPALTSAELDAVDAVVTGATVGVAVTGTIVLTHGPGQGRRALSLVPDRHVCVVHADQVVPDVPQAVGRLADAVRDGRPLTWISGPSATSDIELDRVEGVHGPRTLHVVLVIPGGWAARPVGSGTQDAA
jgi:L-lactate dehydrogenase complex protein LldG